LLKHVNSTRLKSNKHAKMSAIVKHAKMSTIVKYSVDILIFTRLGLVLGFLPGFVRVLIKL
jgi:hypothetical protein